jgi:hypothetical protein
MQDPYTGQQPAAPPKQYDGKNGMPKYDEKNGGHYGASAVIATSNHAPAQETFTGHWTNVRYSRIILICLRRKSLTCSRFHKA